MLKTISEGRDTAGKMTEQLFDSLAKQNGFKVLSGGKYGGNNDLIMYGRLPMVVSF